MVVVKAPTVLSEVLGWFYRGSGQGPSWSVRQSDVPITWLVGELGFGHQLWRGTFLWDLPLGFRPQEGSLTRPTAGSVSALRCTVEGIGQGSVSI